ncbi:methionine adenosyltransferase [Candidatus Gracilibacteria bacterium]|nr:methionine adenosyltransferase [Candidatus Gracilibacteria bacterium]NUJ98560.1 methionine adenosyltransferase [Candidatus Gracilibacteria bacterium]
MKYYITSESVTCGHPDKVCDQISDAILDACLAEDKDSRVACECLTTTGTIVVSGEITTNAWVNFQDIARKVVRDIGYDSLEAGFSADDVSVQILINSQSPDIAQGVDTGGAGDQGIMYGYATNETENYLPAPISFAHKLSRRLEQVRKEKILPFLLPDGKTQVTIEYDENGKIQRVDTIVISSQHKVDVSQEEIHKGIKSQVIDPVLGKYIDEKTIIHINPTGKFTIGGPKGDCGLTGRKIIIDTYGGVGRHGGGAFSGKDPSKVDRSGAYVARYIAKNIVASGICDKCEIQLGYAIGVAEPVSIYVDMFGTEKVSRELVIETIKKNFDLSPRGIITLLDLKKPIYQKTATYGHFGRDDVSWEHLDKVEVFKTLLKK